MTHTYNFMSKTHQDAGESLSPCREPTQLLASITLLPFPPNYCSQFCDQLVKRGTMVKVPRWSRKSRVHPNRRNA